MANHVILLADVIMDGVIIVTYDVIGVSVFTVYDVLLWLMSF